LFISLSPAPFSFSHDSDGEPSSCIYLPRSLSPLLSLSDRLPSLVLSLYYPRCRCRPEPWQVTMPSARWGSNSRGTTIYVLVLHQICSYDSFLSFSKIFIKIFLTPKDKGTIFLSIEVAKKQIMKVEWHRGKQIIWIWKTHAKERIESEGTK